MAERKQSEETGAFEVKEGVPVFDGEAPGSSVNLNYDIPDFGNIADFPDPQSLKTEHSGPAFVVLCDIMSTGYQGDGAIKGQVIRLSEFVPQFADAKPDMEYVKSRIKHYVSTGAIRPADDEEAKQAFVEVTSETESLAVRVERQKRIQLENKLKAAGISLDDLNEGQEDTDEE